MSPMIACGTTTRPAAASTKASWASAVGADFETMPVAPAAMHAASTKRRSSWLYTHTR
ncbi:hypothetical protein [Janibacter melonis]|uniref:hypothetical protein n=1 Tax=Janibacter melonis TaxID=262209 RepID=UPI002095F921|nr:hypothetical protein [Janibacter melonis]